MGWSGIWPVARWQTPLCEDVFNNLARALRERDTLTPAGFVPDDFALLAVIKGVPEGAGGPTGLQTVANFQYEIARMLLTSGAWRWWDRGRASFYTLANLLGDSFGAAAWTHDLGQMNARWTPPFPVIFNELYYTINHLNHLRRLPASAVSSQTDSVYSLTFGATAWPVDRAATFALFDGLDDGASSGLVYDVGLSGVVYDAGSNKQWYVDSRTMDLTFDTSALAGYTVSKAWLEFSTAACPGSTDFSGTFATEVVASGSACGTFASNDYTLKSFEVSGGDINTHGATHFTLRSQKSNTADRTNWAPPGPDYSSTYREGFMLGDTSRLVVEVAFEYRA